MFNRTGLAAMVVACAFAMTTEAASAFGLSFTWGPTKACFDRNSPPMSVSGVPDGTRKLKFRMVDLDAPNYPHGGGSVAWANKAAIPYGAFQYKGPCPPSPHTYEFTVQALDSAGKVLATAKARRKFP